MSVNIFIGRLGTYIQWNLCGTEIVTFGNVVVANAFSKPVLIIGFV